MYVDAKERNWLYPCTIETLFREINRLYYESDRKDLTALYVQFYCEIMISLKELCEKCEVSRRAVQGYEKARLLTSCSRNNRGYLLYEDTSIERVNQIKMFQKFGFQVKEIAEYIDADHEILKQALLVKEKELLEKKEDLESTIEQINRLIEQL